MAESLRITANASKQDIYEEILPQISALIEGAALLPMRARAAKSVARPDAAKLLADLVERTVKRIKE